MVEAQRLAAAMRHAGDDPFRAVISATRAPITICDARAPDVPLIFVNDSFIALTGYTAQDCIGRNCRFLQGSETDRAVVAEIHDAVAAGHAIERDILNYRKDGSLFWCRLGIAPVFNAAGTLTYFFAVQSDVTAERKQIAALASDNRNLAVTAAERLAAATRASEQLRLATEAAGVGVWEIGLPERRLTATPTLNAIYGLPAGATPEYSEIRALAHPEDRAWVTAAFDRAMAGDGDYAVTYRIIRPDGALAWVEARGSVTPGDDGRARRLMGISQDVTARRLAEAALAVSEETLRLAIDAAAIGTWDLDLTTGVLTWPERTKRMFGISPDGPIDLDIFFETLHPDDREPTRAAFAAALDPQLRATYDVEYRAIGREDGIVRWVAARGKGLFVDDVCVRAIGTAIDITVRRRTAERQRFLTEMSDALRDADEPLRAIGIAAQRLGRWLGAGRVGAGRVDEEGGGGGGATIEIATPYNDGMAEFVGVYRLTDLEPSMVAQHRANLTVIDGDFRAPPGRENAPAADTRSFVSVPLVRDGRLRATFFVHFDRPLVLAEDDVRLVEEVADRTWEAAERARAEAESHASEARLRAVVAAAPIGLVFADASGAILGGNARVEQLLRHPVLRVATVEQYREYIAFHSDGRQIEGHEYPLARALAGEEQPELECLYQRGDGTRAYLHFFAAPVRGPDGTITGAVVASIDVDRARRAEMALRELNATLERRVTDTSADRDAIWRESRDLLLIISAAGIMEAVNPAWTETLGYAADDLLGHRYSEFVVPTDIPASDQALATITDAPLRNFENRYRHADGSVRDLAWTASAGNNGKLYCVARDITEQKMAARELELAQEALRQAQKMEAVGQLTGGIAHDFNNMLAVILGSLDLLSRRLDGGDARARRYAEAATEGARRAAVLTQRLLAFSRQQPLQPEPVDINRLVAGMSDLLRGSLGGAVQLETVLAGGLWSVNADPNQLENVILNLGINGRDAMADGGRLTIETANTHLDERYVAAEVGVAAGQYVMIAVTDAGAGMQPEVIAKAFDPFFTTKGVGRGTGLGLSQVYGFVRQSGGHVKIYSEVGVGTTVKLYLPRLVDGMPAIPSRGPDPAVVGGDASELILVVEDEPGVRAVSVDALKTLGYRVIEADGAAAAMPLVEAHPELALLFTDIVMPEVNGARLAEAARALRPGLKVLFTTGYTRNAVVHNGVVDPGVDLIGKPFTIDALAAKVRAVLDAP